MKARIGNTVIAEADEADLISIEGNWYFPPQSIHEGFLKTTATPYTCPWKGAAQYFSVVVDGQEHADNAWSYPQPYALGIERVGKDFSNYVAFWRDVTVD